jgi:hypothetical protein
MADDKKRNLVILRAGDGSLHPQWEVFEKQREFDFWVDYYGNVHGKYQDTCDRYRQSGGTKYPQLYSFIRKNFDTVQKYDAVWLPDDDISCDTVSINNLFALFHQYHLDLAQPSLSVDSYFGYSITVNKPEYVLRYTNWVEGLVPIFSREALMKCLETFSESQSGWGLCWVWPKLLGYPQDKIAIIDGVNVRHARAVGKGDLYRNLKISPSNEKQKIMEKYQIKGYNSCNIIIYRNITNPSFPDISSNR